MNVEAYLLFVLLAVWFEYHSNNPPPPVAKKFYRNLFDWKLEDAPGMEYTMIDGGGMMRNPLPEVHSF
jgi:predicted enzyme related to lactoylglutathione lyase